MPRKKKEGSTTKKLEKLRISSDLVKELERTDIQNFYYYDPIAFFKKYFPELKWPKVIREVFMHLYEGKSRKAIIKACRGGGKSQVISALLFALWFFKRRKCIDMGGSMQQAEIVYNYVMQYAQSDDIILEALGVKKMLMKKTEDKDDKYIGCVSASPKAVRGPHPDVLAIDEVAEADDDIVLSALPMVNTSQSPLIAMASTFHKIFGIFQETWDMADERGYKRFQWDIFDVVREFDPAIWDDETLNREIHDLQELKKLTNGRIGDPDGWIPIENVIDGWRQKQSLSWFLVEYMGSRPSAEGLVFDPVDIDACTVEELPFTEEDKVGAEFSMGIDWGFSSMTSVTDYMWWKDNKKALVYNKNYTQTDLCVIIKDVVEYCKKYPRRIIYADSAGKFENRELQLALKEARLSTAVVEVVFSKEKVELLGNVRAHFENHNLIIPKEFQLALWQFKRYRYQNNSDKPLKEHDHIPDSTLCALKEWSVRVGHLEVVKDNESKPMITQGLLDKKF